MTLRLPEGGFNHPFQETAYDFGPRQGKEHPRTVSDDPPAPRQAYIVTRFLSDRRATDVRPL